MVPERTELIRRLLAAQNRVNQALKHRLIRRRLRLERCLRSQLFRRPRELVRERIQALDQLQERLAIAAEKWLERKKQRWQLADEKLNMLNPLKVLQRGYSVVRRPDGQIVCRAETVGTGEVLDVWLQEGRLKVLVTETEKVRG